MRDDIKALKLACESSLIAFSTLTHPNYVPSWHHRQIGEAMKRVKEGTCKRLIITMPPRHGKTELASIRFAPWVFTTCDDLQIITASYAGEFSDELGAKARGVIESEIYQSLWPHAKLRRGTRAVSRWNTMNGCSYYGVGVGGPLTGKGAHILLIDDPHKNREEAESDIVRGKVWDWFRSTAYTRLEKDGAVIIIMTRWHEDDLVGRVLESGEEWEVLSLPAIAEEDEVHRVVGQALWPEKYDADTLQTIERTVGEREWNALYQQHPTSPKGILFKVENVPIIEAEPADYDWVRAWDFASLDHDGDYTAGVRIGFKEGRIVIGDMVRFQGTPDRVFDVTKATASRDSKKTRIGIPQDPGQAGKSHVQAMSKNLSGYRIVSTPESGSKTLRAEAFAAQVNVGNVSLVRGPWNSAYLEELRAFPNGRHDDQVDASSRAYAMFVDNHPLNFLDYLKNLAAKRKAAQQETSNA